MEIGTMSDEKKSIRYRWGWYDAFYEFGLNEHFGIDVDEEMFENQAEHMGTYEYYEGQTDGFRKIINALLDGEVSKEDVKR